MLTRPRLSGLRLHTQSPPALVSGAAIFRTLSFPALGLLTLALGGCGLSSPPTAEDRETRADCDAEADRIFAAQNRYQLSERNSTDTPYAGNTLPSNPTAGLSDQYAQDRLVDNCLRRGGAGSPGASTGQPAAQTPAGQTPAHPAAASQN